MKFKDVAHLYLGCDCYEDSFKREVFKFVEAGYSFSKICSLDGEMDKKVATAYLIPILRPLSDMKDNETVEYNIIQIKCYSTNMFSDQCISEAMKTNYLLSKRFDLFGLIESGEAIDATTH